MANPLTITCTEGKLRATLSRQVALYETVPVSVTGLVWTAGHTYLALLWRDATDMGVVDIISESVAGGTSIVTWTYSFPFTSADLIAACSPGGCQATFGLWDSTDDRWVFKTPIGIEYAPEPTGFVAVTPSVTAATMAQVNTAIAAIITDSGATNGQVATYDSALGYFKPATPGAADVGTAIHGASTKGSLADGDEVPICDSADTYSLKKVLWSTIKGLFALLGHTHTGTTDGSKLAQSVTHESADTDSATSSLHHTIGSGATNAAAGNHSHAGYASTSHASTHSDGGSDEVAPYAIGAKRFHGVEAHGTISWDDTEHTLTVASLTYWFQGTKYTTASPVVCDLDLAADRDHASAALTANTMYFLYAKDATGKIYWSPTAWSISESYVLIASVFWNGSLGAPCEETHKHDRSIPEHALLHATVGARISPADFAMTAPSSGSPSTVDFAGGTLWDEDHAQAHGQQTNCRVWYPISASGYTFINSTTLYGAAVSFVDSSDSYTRKAITTGYANYWVYAAPDISRGIWAFEEARAVGGTTGYVNLAAARAASPPTLANMGITPELKLLYRVTMQYNETFGESADYRASAALPAGGTTAPTAASVSVVPSGTIAASNVQAALEELDTEKLSTVKRTIVFNFDGGGSEIADNAVCYFRLPWAFAATSWTLVGDVSGAIKIDVWVDDFANGLPTNADSVTNGHEPEIAASGTTAEDTNITDWSDVAWASGQMIAASVDSCTTTTRAVLIIEGTSTT